MSELVRQVAHKPEELAELLIARASAGDVAGMVALYEPNAILAGLGGQTTIGHEAIGKFYAELLSTGMKFSLGNQRPAIVNGDLALTSSRLPNGTVTAEVAHRQPDGTWLWVIDNPGINL